MSIAIAEVVFTLDAFQCAERVAAYVALGDEVPMEMILDAVLASGRTLLLPRAAECGLDFAAVDDLAHLHRGSSGVLEPVGARPRSPLVPGDLVLVPGLAFDRRGHRLGRGGGHYDRVFASLDAQLLRVGIAFSFQLVASVPVGDRDCRVDGVAIETGFIPASVEPQDPMLESG